MNDTDLKLEYRSDGHLSAFPAKKKVWSREEITSIFLQEVQKKMKFSEKINDKTNLLTYFNDKEIVEMKIYIFNLLKTGLNIDVSIPQELSKGCGELAQHTVSGLVDEVIFGMNNPQAAKK